MLDIPAKKDIETPFKCISYQIQESSKSAQLRVRAKQENVSGVMLPVFEMYNEGGNGKAAISVSFFMTKVTNVHYFFDSL
jgi:vacuolar-type H+-ATPase subunit D/Vma8